MYEILEEKIIGSSKFGILDAKAIMKPADKQDEKLRTFWFLLNAEIICGLAISDTYWYENQETKDVPIRFSVDKQGIIIWKWYFRVGNRNKNK